MAAISISEALRQLFSEQRWDNRLYDKRLRSEWQEIVGKTISKYTDSLYLSGKTLTIHTQVPVLKHELQIMRPQLMQRINEHFDAVVVNDIVIK